MNKRTRKKSLSCVKRIFHKEFDVACLLSSPESISNRIDQINTFDYSKYESLARTSIARRGNAYIYKQEHFRCVAHEVDKSALRILADALQYLSDIDFIHGDINRKNVIYTDQGYKVIDFEPDLHQIKHGVVQRMVTIPYIAKSELKDNDISNLTDKIGFIYFLLRIQGMLGPKQIVSLSKSFDHEAFIGMREEEITHTSYRCLLEKYL